MFSSLAIFFVSFASSHYYLVECTIAFETAQHMNRMRIIIVNANSVLVDNNQMPISFLLNLCHLRGEAVVLVTADVRVTCLILVVLA